MKIFTTVATMIGLAAGSSVQAQTMRIQDQFHTVSAQLCFPNPNMIEQFIETETEQRKLFTSIGTVVLTDKNSVESENPVVISVYVDPITGNFTVTKSFVDGVTCLLTEGTGFEPYVE